MTQPAGRYSYFQSKARYWSSIFRKISPYKQIRNPVDEATFNDTFASADAVLEACVDVMIAFLVISSNSLSSSEILILGMEYILQIPYLRDTELVAKRTFEMHLVGLFKMH